MVNQSKIKRLILQFSNAKSYDYPSTIPPSGLIVDPLMGFKPCDFLAIHGHSQTSIQKPTL